MNVTTKILRLPEVIKSTGLSKSSLYRFRALGLFPAPVKLGIKAVGWHLAEIEAWLASRPTVGAKA